MRGVVLALVLILISVSVSNTQKPLRPLDPEHKLFIITLDGFRWQEVFGGADSMLLHQPSVTPDTAIAKALYWADAPAQRRQRLLPFLWSVVGRQGQLYGNRLYDNNVNVANPYALSYPGYSELLTGSVDFRITNNKKRNNRNRNILEQLNSEGHYAGKVAAFTSWDVFPYILHGERNELPVNSGLQSVEGPSLSRAEQLINSLQEEVITEKTETRYDALTYIACREYVLRHKPAVVLLSFSGTDDAGHERRYDKYLQQATQADRMIGELWQLLQTLPEYAGKTTFLITTDHGRGQAASSWSRHGFFVGGSSQTWFALLGPDVAPTGEMKAASQFYQKELSELMLQLLSQKPAAGAQAAVKKD